MINDNEEIYSTPYDAIHGASNNPVDYEKLHDDVARNIQKILQNCKLKIYNYFILMNCFIFLKCPQCNEWKNNSQVYPYHQRPVIKCKHKTQFQFFKLQGNIMLRFVYLALM